MEPNYCIYFFFFTNMFRWIEYKIILKHLLQFSAMQVEGFIY